MSTLLLRLAGPLQAWDMIQNLRQGGQGESRLRVEWLDF